MREKTLLDNLFRRIAFNDDPEAFKELFFDFYPSLCLFAQRYIPSPETCEDIVQETFLNIWKNRKKIEITSSIKNFLITGVKNSCIDYIRKQSVRRDHANKQTGLTNIDTPENIYTIRELEAMLHTVLTQMPENVRRAFELSRFENMTYKLIADEMAVSPKTVESYISKALTILRRELKDYLPLLFLI